MKLSAIASLIIALFAIAQSGCISEAFSSTPEHDAHGEPSADGEGHGEGGHEHAVHKIVVTSAVRQDVINTQQYVCLIHSCRHIEVRALERGYLEQVGIKEGQLVSKGDMLFQLLPTIYQARLAAERAEAERIRIELTNAESLRDKNILSGQAIALKQAELARAEAQVSLAEAELGFTNVTAPFDGIVDRQMQQLGSLVEEGDVLTTLSDNSVMWVYFNVPEARYLQYKADLDAANSNAHQLSIELKLANGQIFPQPGVIGAIEADFNNETGNIAFRADFENPTGLLRNGQTGTILIHTTHKDAIVIPQRATYEILAKQYVYVVDADNVVHQRDIVVGSEHEDTFVIEEGLEEGDRIILEGIGQVRDGDVVEYEFLPPEEALSNLKFHAE